MNIVPNMFPLLLTPGKWSAGPLPRNIPEGIFSPCWKSENGDGISADSSGFPRNADQCSPKFKGLALDSRTELICVSYG